MRLLLVRLQLCLVYALQLTYMGGFYLFYLRFKVY